MNERTKLKKKDFVNKEEKKRYGKIADDWIEDKMKDFKTE